MQGTTLDDLIVRIRADTKSLNAALGRLKGDLGGVSGKAKATGAMTAGALAGIKGKALAAAAAVATIGTAINKVAQAGMVFEDLKDSLDIVFGGAQEGDKALAEITRFAQTTPFQIDDVTKAFIGLKSAGIEPTVKMLQTFADTASIATDQKGTFEALITFFQRSAAGGASLVELNRINDRGIDIFGRLEKEIGKSRTELSTFGQTAEGSRIIQEALIKVLERDFGGAMASKMDNLSTKASNMQIAFKVLGDELFKSGIGDMLKRMADRMTSIADAISRSLRDLRNERSLSDLGISETKGSGEFVKTTSGEEIELTEAKTDEELLLEVQAKIIKLQRLQKQAMDTQQNFVMSTKDSLQMSGVSRVLDHQDTINELREHEIQLLQAVADKKKLNQELDEKGLKTATTDQISNLSKLEKILEDSRDPAEKLAETVKMITDMKGVVDKDGALFFTDEELERMRKFVQSQVPEQMEEIVALSDHMRDAIAQTAHSFTNDFVNALLDGEDALESFKDFSKTLVSQIISTFMQLAVVNQILNSIFGQGTFDTLSFTSDGIKVNKATQGTDDNTRSGGRVHAGLATLVGESGPEIFVPHSSGTVLNSMNTRAAMSGAGGPPITIVQDINFATGVVPTVRAEVQNMLPQIADVAKGAVLDAAARGGAYRRGLGGG